MQSFDIPNGSNIKKEISSDGFTTLFWNKPNGGIQRYFISVFMLAWIGGWFIGFKDVVIQLINKPQSEANGFLMFWLLAWVAGGSLVFYYILLILRPQKPEKITIHLDYIEYDTGTFSPITAGYNRGKTFNQFNQWNDYFQKRKVFSNLQRSQIKFVHEKNPSRIYFDWESKRYEVGSGLSEPDIDWLYSKLSN